MHSTIQTVMIILSSLLVATAAVSTEPTRFSESFQVVYDSWINGEIESLELVQQMDRFSIRVEAEPESWEHF
jgi:hypothetical protein